MKEIIFVEKLPSQGPCSYVNLTQTLGGTLNDSTEDVEEIPLNVVFREQEEEWKRQFIDAMGGVNSACCDFQWWAFTTSAKNFLSSPLGGRVFQVLALCRLVEAQNFNKLYIIGASEAQVAVFCAWSSENPCNIKIQACEAPTHIGRNGHRILRNLYQIFRIGWFFLALKRQTQPPAEPIDLCVFTYIDERTASGSDAFFGNLVDRIHNRFPELRIQTVSYVHSRYRDVLSGIGRTFREQFYPLFYTLRFSDYVWAFFLTCGIKPEQIVSGVSFSIDRLNLVPLLVESLWRDLVSGNYLHNILLFRATKRFMSQYHPKEVIYPFENKALEKMLVIAGRGSGAPIRMTGYQHTSVTPRHTTLLFAKNEAAITPLPDKIVTTGSVTKEYLETHGNYPAGILQAGCALRQVWREDCFDDIAKPEVTIQLLLALSSSKEELVSAVGFCRRVSLMPGIRFKLGIRPHPEFPLTLLSPVLQVWLSDCAIDFSNTDLAKNIGWCDAVLYVSSTVALEALMRGKPVVNLRLGDVINPDPVLGGRVALHWRIYQEGDLRDILKEIPEIKMGEREAAIAYVKDYLTPASDECVGKFVEYRKPMENGRSGRYDPCSEF